MSSWPRTVCFDFSTGISLTTFPYLMKLVKVGEEFYIGQQPYIVERLTLNEEQGEAVVELSKKGSENDRREEARSSGLGT